MAPEVIDRPLQHFTILSDLPLDRRRSAPNQLRWMVGSLLVFALCARGAAGGASEFVYVSDERGNEVTAIDLSDGTVVARIAVGKRPRGIQTSRDGALLFVAVSGSSIAGPGVDESKLPPADRTADGIAVVDTATGKVLRVLKAGTDPEAFALGPDGKILYAANEDASLVSVIDATGRSQLRQTKVGAQPEGIAVTPDGERIFVASEASDVVTMLDARTLSPVKTLAIAGRPRTLLTSGDGSVIYAAIETAGQVAVISAANGDLQKLIDVAGGDRAVRPMGLVEARGGRSLFVTTGWAGAILELDVARGTLIRRIDGVGARPWGIALSADGQTLVTANGPSGDISLIDRASGEVRARYKIGVSPWGVAMKPIDAT